MLDNLPGIEEVVDILGLERDPKSKRGDSTFSVRCPFCGGNSRKYKMRINTQINGYYCFKCSGGEKGLGVLDLYGRVRMGVRHIKGSSGNGKEIMARLREEMHLDAPTQNRGSKWKSKSAVPQRKELLPAADAKLDKAYQFILRLPMFKLSQTHHANLIKRGLDDEAIARNGYATLPQDVSWAKQNPVFWKAYDENGLKEEKDKYRPLRGKTKGEIVAGMALAALMTEAGISLKGIPGAFTLKQFWCVIYTPGMLIPTRNEKGQIVALQTRLDKGNLRYMTMSAGGCPNAVESRVSRTHFPLANSSIREAKEILCTEGPLKADVIAHLYGGPVYIMALHGVSNTRELTRIFRQLKLEEVIKIGNAFDMDKLANTNVRTQSKALVQKAIDSGLSMYQKCWDIDYAREKCKELKDVCVQNNVLYQLSENPFSQVAYMADALKEANVPFCIKPNGEHDYWRDETKGLDDYYLWIRNL